MSTEPSVTLRSRPARSVMMIAMLWCLVILTLVAMGGVDVPFEDDWDGVANFMVQAMTQGLSWDLLWVPHNEHYLPLARLAIYVLNGFGIDTVRLMIVSTLLHFTAMFLFMRVLFTKSTLHEEQPGSAPARQTGWLFLTCVLVFTCLIQRLNFFMGFQLFWVMGAFGQVLCLVGLARRRPLVAFVGLCVACLSLSASVCLAPVVTLALAQELMGRGKRFRDRPEAQLFRSFGWYVVSVVSGWAFAFWVVSHGLSQLVDGHANGRADVLNVARFFFTLLGAPLSGHSKVLAPTLGIAFIATYVLNAKRFAEGHSRLTLYTMSFALVAAAGIALARAPLGIAYAFGSHYSALTLPAWTAWSHHVVSEGLPPKLKGPALAIICAVVIGIDGYLLHKELWQRRPRLLEARACVLVDNASPGASCFSFLYPPAPGKAFEISRRLKELRFWPH